MTPDDAIIWPPRINRPLTVKFNLAGSTISPGQTQAGTFPFARFDGGGFWTATLAQLLLCVEDDVRAFRAVRMLAQGGVVPVIVPRKDAKLPPFPTINGALVQSYGAVPHAGRAMFSDGSGYAQPVIVASVSGGGTLRATSLSIDFAVGGPPRGGEAFSLCHPTQGWRMYEITTVAPYTGGAVVTFDPPLRDVIAPDAPAEFDLPRCTMRLAKFDSMDLELATYPFPRPSVNFVEYFFPSS